MADLDRIFASVPLNATAGRVTARGVHWTPDRKSPVGYQRHDAPPIMVRPEDYPTCAGFEDLRGRRLGRFTVVGYIGKRNPKKKALWVVRCVCGSYEERTAAAIKHECDDACLDCRHLKYIKAHQRGPVRHG